MITRIWHGKTKAEHADIYLKYVQETGLTDYVSTPGNMSAKILHKIQLGYSLTYAVCIFTFYRMVC